MESVGRLSRGSWRLSGGCGEAVWRVLGDCLGVLGGFPHGFWRLCERCGETLEGVGRLSGGGQEAAWTVQRLYRGCRDIV